MTLEPAEALRRCMRAWRLRPAPVVSTFATKNLTQLARARDGRRVFLKCAPNPFDRGVQREADAIAHVRDAIDPKLLRVPDLIGFDANRNVLALEFIARAPTLYAQHRERRALPLRRLREIGRSLAALHASSAQPAWAEPPADTLLECFVWTRPDFATRLPPDGMLLFGTLQADARARDGLIELIQDPQRRALIHGDAKALNILLPARGAPVWLDWELAHFGDPAQDLGSLAADLARCQIAPEQPSEKLSVNALNDGLAALFDGYGPLSRAMRRRVRLWMGAHLLIYAHAMVLGDGELHALPHRLLTRARKLLHA